MFESARIKLTAWYLLIIMTVSISFSAAIFRVLTFELDRVVRLQRLRTEMGFVLPQRIPPLDEDLMAETRNRLFFYLALLNMVIAGSSAAAGYWLAGRTLKPIQEMVLEQNRFVADASHELRTPLTALKTGIEVNLRDKNLTLDDAKKLIASNLEDVNNLQVLSDDLIKIFKFQEGRNTWEMSKVSTTEIMDEAIKKTVVLAKKRQIEIENTLTDRQIKGNKPALTELLVIFLDNAIKYGKKGGKIRISSGKTGSGASIVIADDGVGITNEDMPHIFDRFYRADKSRTKTNAAGYGLGLAIARQIVDRHHGSIKVQSHPGDGTTFVINLPS